MTRVTIQGFGYRMLLDHQLAVQGGIYPRSARVSLLVGTLLNLINQPEWLFGLAPVQPFKMLFTYLVPFLVATYGAVTAVQARVGHDCNRAQPQDS